MNDNMSKSDMNADCLLRLEDIGKAYGRIIFQRAIMLQLPPDEVEEGINAAVEDSRDFFKENGIDDHDTDIACSTIKLAIVTEGHRIVMATPDEIGGLQ
ncbi:hypothetical protein [uncultured Agrobacterium sp.]|uniref:hypothetical protein n=1 Tax=uncultured Agrobacterium sp. TaxID=157277 RepID=UPI002583F137|nr:hypothetical protein [uncultured Agrobacterium sp.]